MQRSELINRLNQLLQPQLFKDYCPNGLQVEGRLQINKVISGVSLNQELIAAAIAAGADTILTHHGLIWHKSAAAITGVKYQRLAKLIKHDLNLIAYHLPLDNHPQLGNNAQLAQVLGFTVEGQTGDQGLLWYGSHEHGLTPLQLKHLIARTTCRQPQYFGPQAGVFKRLAWCTGAAESMFASAIELGVDCFISGEIAEPIVHLAQESGVGFVAAGHYATERYGIMALTEQLRSWGLDAEFVEIANPI